MEMDELLRALECDCVNATKARFLEDGAFYLQIAKEALNDPGFERLGTQLAQEEAAAAFDTAHMLKGLIANFGITPLYNLTVQIVEALRTEAPDAAQLHALFAQLMQQRALDQKILSEFTEA